MSSDSAQIDPELQSVVSVEAMVSAVEETGVAVNWLISPPQLQRDGSKPCTSTEKKLLLGFITGVFVTIGRQLGFKVEMDEDSGTVMPKVLLTAGNGFQIRVCSSLEENTIHPESLEGAGEITPVHGHVPLLALLYLQDRFEGEFPEAAGPLVTMCDESGHAFSLSSFDLLYTEVLQRMGFDYDAVFIDAEKVGLIVKMGNWSDPDMEVDVEDFFF